MEIYRLNRQDQKSTHLLDLLTIAAKEISAFYLKAKAVSSKDKFVTLRATFDGEWSSTDEWSCLTGSAQTAFFLRRMHRLTSLDETKTAADMLLDDLKRLQFFGDRYDDNLLGGLPGSFPIKSPYLGYAILNWDVKFYADALLQRLLPEKDQQSLG